ncbi:hypothetical protein KQX54_008298 [Cotesia glomerata]|uniref:Uncharacterized protein n=1 Tax=Cotesia glomerata TaxID=32391 RepID=A0AAV7I2B8_COTGL|nr:hypothetical protein KQX54_008298 [Cotesia glomerata]
MNDLNKTKSSASNSEANAHKNSQTSRQDIPLTKLPVAKNQKSQTYEMSEPDSSLVHLSLSNPHGKKNFALVTHDLPVVPFFDMSEYKPTLPLPLGGIGLMYKSVPNHAGFLAFKFISSSYTHYISYDYAEKLAPKLVK